MFSYTTKSGVLRVYEAFNGFYVEHVPSGNVRGIGDGVDQFCVDDDDCGFRTVASGSDEFYELLKSDVESSESEYIEAYFPEHYEG